MSKDSTTNITFPIMISEFCIIVLYISFSTKVSEWCIVHTCATVLSSVPRVPDWLGPVGWSSLGWAWNLHLEMEYWGWKSKIKAHPLSSAASCFSTPNVIGTTLLLFLKPIEGQTHSAYRSLSALVARLYSPVIYVFSRGRIFLPLLNFFKWISHSKREKGNMM